MPNAATKRYWDELPQFCEVCGARTKCARCRILRYSANTENGCREWTRTKNQRGYGRLRVNDHLQSAHRLSYELFIGPIPDGMEIDHLCGNRACIHPEHLEPVTHEENVARGNAGKWLAAKTHCPKGHPYSGDNLHVGRRGERRCRTCMKVQWADANEKRRVRS